jgi:hypothetical protein
MAKNDFLDGIDGVMDDADLQSPKKKAAATTGKKKKKILNLSIEVDWFNIIKANSNTVTGYIIEATREKMKRDGLL